LPGGIRILFAPAIPPAQPTEIARWVPTIFGVDGLYNVLLDARYCHGEWCTREGRWTVRNVSNLVLFAVPGVFPVQPPGTPPSPLLGYRAGDIISYGYTNHLRIDSNWN